ncbi:MAG: ketopantoate reductase family protein [Acidimicrobiales bacterium]
MRFVIVGPGAVGGTIGARLAQAGYPVALIARGAHKDAIDERGLEIRDPEGTATLKLPVFDRISSLEPTDDDIVITSVKTQDAEAVLSELAAVLPATVPIVCAQNGVEGERLALRRFENVYAMCVMLPASHLHPGVVVAHSHPVAGILDLGRYPSGLDDRCVAIAVALEEAGFSSEAVPGILRRKYAKLLANLGNAIDAACGPAGRGSDLYRRARLEAIACFAQAGIEVASDDEDRARRGEILSIRPVDGSPRGGGSSWQSLARGTGAIETDFLNGEVVLLGRLHGVPTPVNAMLQHVARQLAEQRRPAGSLTVGALEARLLA